ncbi:MAG TPA: hypothetical protein VF538_04745 [Pyrinomonadaceae bacterium]|jgi:hypothetical protein
MKMRVTLTLLLLCAPVATARAVSDEGEGVAPRGVTILRFDWYDNTHRSNWDSYSGADASQSSDNTPPQMAPAGQAAAGSEGAFGTRSASGTAESGLRVIRSGDRGSASSGAVPTRSVSGTPLMGRKVVEYVYRMKLRNDAEKAISAVDWEYQFLDPDTGRQLDHHRFASFGRIKPGKSRTLQSASITPPAKVISAAALGRGKKPAYKERVVVKCVAYSDGSFGWHDSGDKDDCERLQLLAKKQRN